MDTNSPPVFTPESIAPDGSTITLEGENNKIYVIAQDDQTDLLYFYFELDGRELLQGGEYLPIDDPYRQGFQITLSADRERFDGEILTCSVYDNGNNRAEISWLLEVP